MKRQVIAGLVAIAIVAVAPQVAAGAAIERVSDQRTGGEWPAISADGRYVAFTSPTAHGTTALDTSGAVDPAAFRFDGGPQQPILPAALPGPADIHPIEIAGQDDDAVVYDWRHRRKLAFRLYARLKVKYIRMVLRAQDVGRNEQGYFDAIAAARRRGMDIELTIEKPSHTPTVGEFRHYLRRIIGDFGKRVQRISIFNEPNLLQGAWVSPVRYRRLYAVAYSMIKRADPNVQVLLGELAPIPENGFVAYLQGVLCLNAQNQPLGPQCTPVRTDGLAVHPYQFGVSPQRRTPAIFGIGSLDRLRSDARAFVASRMLLMPPTTDPTLFLTEFGYTAPQGPWSTANRRRARWMVEAYSIACQTPGVEQLLTFQLFPSEPGWSWDSSIVDARGRPTVVYNMLQRWVDKHPQCVSR